MIRIVSNIAFAHPDEIATVTISIKAKITDHANFTVESANPGGYWGSQLPQLPKDVVVPSHMIVQSFSGVVHEDKPEVVLTIKYLYPTWIRVVQYLSVAEVPSVEAKIKLDTPGWTKFKRFWQFNKIERPTERIS